MATRARENAWADPRCVGLEAIDVSPGVHKCCRHRPSVSLLAATWGVCVRCGPCASEHVYILV